MFSIGKLVDYSYFDHNNISGHILLVSPRQGEVVSFNNDNIYEFSILRRKPYKVKIGSYIAFNLKGNPPEPIELISNLVATIDEVIPTSLLRLISENGHKGPEVDSIVLKYCSGIEKSRPKKIENDKAFSVRQNTLPVKKRVEKKKFKDPDVNLAFENIYRKHAFDLVTWKNASDAFKAKIIFCASMVLKEKGEEFIPPLQDIIAYEREREHKIILALLLFLITIQENDMKKKISVWRDAHETLLTSISLAYRNEKRDDILPILSVMLPMCSENGKVFCDAYGRYDWWAVSPYITCTQKDYGSVPICMGYGNNQDKSILADFSKPYFEKVRNREANPDLRVLLHNIHFDLNSIPRHSISEKLDSYAYPYRLSAFVKRLNGVWPYLSCKMCNDSLFPDFEYKDASDVYTLTKFTCKNYVGDKTAHNFQTYLNYCYACAKEKRGIMTIDSRECVRKKDSKKNTGMWICMRCGGAREYRSRCFCPACGSQNIEILPDGAVRCKEKECGLDGSLYGKKPVSLEEIYRFEKYRKSSTNAI